MPWTLCNILISAHRRFRQIQETSQLSKTLTSWIVESSMIGERIFLQHLGAVQLVEVISKGLEVLTPALPMMASVETAYTAADIITVDILLLSAPLGTALMEPMSGGLPGLGTEHPTAYLPDHHRRLTPIPTVGMRTTPTPLEIEIGRQGAGREALAVLAG